MSDFENPDKNKKINPAQSSIEDLKDYQDVWNALSGIQLARNKLRRSSEVTIPELGRILNPLPTYEEYFATKGYVGITNNPVIVNAFNALVVQFNADRERIINQKDLQSMTRFLDEFRNIIDKE